MDRRLKYVFDILFLLLFVVVTIILINQSRDISALRTQVNTIKSGNLMDLATVTAGSGAFRWRNGLTGGSDSLDGIGCASLNDGDAAIVAIISGTTTTLYFYVWDDDSNAAESSPGIIPPDDRAANCAGLGVWRLGSVYSPIFYSSAADGEHYIDMSNSTDLASGSRVDGRCWYDKAQNRIECYDGTNIQYWTATGNQ